MINITLAEELIQKIQELIKTFDDNWTFKGSVFGKKGNSVRAVFKLKTNNLGNFPQNTWYLRHIEFEIIAKLKDIFKFESLRYVNYINEKKALFTQTVYIKIKRKLTERDRELDAIREEFRNNHIDQEYLFMLIHARITIESGLILNKFDDLFYNPSYFLKNPNKTYYHYPTNEFYNYIKELEEI